MALTPFLVALKFRRCKARGPIKPGRQNRAGSQSRRLLRQSRENGVCNFLSLVRSAKLPHGHAVNQPAMPFHQLAECIFRGFFGVTAQQLMVVHIVNLTQYTRANEKVTGNLSRMEDARANS